MVGANCKQLSIQEMFEILGKVDDCEQLFSGDTVLALGLGKGTYSVGNGPSYTVNVLR